MQPLSPHTATLPDAELVKEEKLIGRIAFSGGLAVGAVTMVSLATILATTATEWWQYGLYATMAGVPFVYALFANLVLRRMDQALFARFRTRLMSQITDLQEMVYRDEMTGLFNRRHFYEVMKVEVEKAVLSKRPLAVMLLDLDGLKLINDEYGHGVGDTVIANLGRTIATHTRGADVPARLGGDEFGIVMPGTDKRGAFALARRLWADLEATPMFLEGSKALTITVSVGLAGYPWGGESVEEIIQWADADMYANKVGRKLSHEAVPAVAAPADLDEAGDDLLGRI